MEEDSVTVLKWSLITSSDQDIAKSILNKIFKFLSLALCSLLSNKNSHDMQIFLSDVAVKKKAVDSDMTWPKIAYFIFFFLKRQARKC